MRTLVIAFVALCVASSTSRADSKPKAPPTVRTISYTVQRPPDGKKYPNPVNETYILSRDGTLDYRAYFGNMPIELNHNDSIVWKGGAAVLAVIDVVEKNKGGLVELADGKSPPADAVHLVSLSDGNGDTTRFCRDKSPAWKVIDPAFQTLIAQFEKATNRPLTPAKLQQK